METTRLLPEDPDHNPAIPLLSVEKDLEVTREHANLDFYTNAPSKGDALSRWTLSARRLLSSPNLLHPRPCCQSRPARVLHWSLRAVVLFVALSLVNAILRPSYASPPAHYKSLEEHVLSSTDHGRGNPKSEKVYIAANIINEDLIRGKWGTSLYELVELLGEDNVFVSIYENDSGEGTVAALRALQQKLKCKTSIVTGGHLPLSDFPKMLLPNGEERVQRITYLSKIRNQLLRPLDPVFAVSNETNGFRSASHLDFDRILFLNDVYFNPVDALQLLFSTNEGKYRAACAVDFIHGPLFYDTFATRDHEGYRNGLMVYPWFAPVGDSISRNDVRSQTDAVRVRSCWGGMAAFEASLFRPTPEVEHSCANTAASCLPLQFRGSSETFWEAAECCLIFADIEAGSGRSEKIFLNPHIRVAYTERDFNLIPFFRRFERFFEYLQYVISKMAYPEMNRRRTHEAGEWVDEVVWKDAMSGPVRNNTTLRGYEYLTDNDLNTQIIAKAGQWNIVRRQASPGGFCGQRNMFVMKNNLEEANENSKEGGKNWDKIPVPRMGR